jgi:hypothetical protein
MPEELRPMADRLRRERDVPTPLELDRIKLRAIRGSVSPRSSRFARQKGNFMRSRLAMLLVIAAGFMLSTTGVGLAISGTSGSGSAAQNQYKHVSPNKGHGGKNGVKGVTLASEEEPPTAEVEPAPTAVEQVETTSSSGSLPFTGFLAIPLLIVGVGLLSLGAVIRRKTSHGGRLS